MFDELMDSYKKLSINSKREANLKEIKKLVAITSALCEKNGIDYRDVKSKEVNDLNNDIVLENDYLEAQFVYITYLKETIGALLDSKF